MRSFKTRSVLCAQLWCFFSQRLPLLNFLFESPALYLLCILHVSLQAQRSLLGAPFPFACHFCPHSLVRLPGPAKWVWGPALPFTVCCVLRLVGPCGLATVRRSVHSWEKHQTLTIAFVTVVAPLITSLLAAVLLTTRQTVGSQREEWAAARLSLLSISFPTLTSLALTAHLHAHLSPAIRGHTISDRGRYRYNILFGHTLMKVRAYKSGMSGLAAVAAA